MNPETSQATHATKVCERCIGRAFANVGSGISNNERGHNFLENPENSYLFNGLTVVEEDSCQICHGVFKRLDLYFEEFINQSRDLEYNTYLVGSKFPVETVSLDQELQKLLDSDKGEPIKREFNREFGKLINEKTGKEAEFNEPDLNIVVDLSYDSFQLKTRSIYIYGIYRKMRRDIPQTRWIHKKDISTSVETVIGDILKSMAQGRNYFLHGAGREDVDVQMLGNGRQFIIEVSEPKRRSISLEDLQQKVNGLNEGVEISNLRLTSRAEVAKLKASANDKTYLVRVKAASDIDRKRIIEAAEKLSGKHIYQRTPLRVSTRRSDLIRDKQLQEVTVEETLGNIAVVKVRAEAGTYIKELIHGDDGRTKPSLSDVYGEQLTVETLDVIWIHRSDE
jgi:tRNA pseudouridine synthase 10